MVGVFLYLIRQNELSLETFYFGILLFLMMSWFNFDLLRGGKTFSILYESDHGRTGDEYIRHVTAMTVIGYSVLLIAVVMVMSLERIFDAVLANLLFFGALFCFWFIPLVLSWRRYSLIQRFAYIFFFSYFVVLPQFVLSLYNDQRYPLFGGVILAILVIAHFLTKRNHKEEEGVP
jgi:K+-sensing histidine kinase KdpD